MNRLRVDLNNYSKESTLVRRKATRAIIRKEEKYLLIYSKYGDYKFPGGGMEEGEEIEETLLREVKEETGYEVTKSSIKDYMNVFEKRKIDRVTTLEMESLYFSCEVILEQGVRNLDPYEKEYEYEVIWATLEEAIEANRRVFDYETCPWVERELKVMEYLRNENILYENICPNLPPRVRDLIEGQYFAADNIGQSNASVYLFDNDMVLKVEENSSQAQREYEMMKWLKDKLRVPKIIHRHVDDTRSYLLMTKLDGAMVCDFENLSNLETIVKTLAKGLKQLWEVDITHCPSRMDLDYKLELALDRINKNLVDIEDCEPETFGESGFENPMALYKYLKKNKPIEEKVLSHGDYCLPNIFIHKDQVLGFLDLGRCGVGDKWQDIALGVRSIRHNLVEIGRGGELTTLLHIFFEELDMEPDEDKITYYILLDELF